MSKKTKISADMHKTDWFFQSKYGVMFHFLPKPWKETSWKYPFFENTPPTSPSEWNRLVERFDVDAVIDQMNEAEAGYLLLTLGQASGYYLAPNSVYNQLCGYAEGERCSFRDLPLELFSALDRNQKKLMLYLPIETAPDEAGKLGWADYDKKYNKRAKPDAFIDLWCSVIEWWSNHYGTKLSGWWFDNAACTQQQAERLAKAATSGNPECITNLPECGNYIGGHCAIAHSRFEDPELFGRIDWEIQKDRIPDGRFTADGKQWHALLHFGEHWWDRDGFYDTTTEVDYTKQAVENGGVVTWDCGPNIGRSDGSVGTISEAQMVKLRRIRDVIRR